MTTRRASIRFSGLLSALALLVPMSMTAPACDPDPIFMECPLSSSIIRVCEERAEGNDVFTCVVEDHPFCLEKVCASWRLQPSVCTRVCTEGGSECPTGSNCRYDELLDLRFCVLDTHFEAAEQGTVAGQ